jgi:hypothetical protein
MKTAMNNFKMMAVVLTGVFTMLLSNVSFANNEKDNDTNRKAGLQFVGSFENQSMFRLVLSNDSNADYIVTVIEKSGDILFTEKLSGANISRVYKLDIENISVVEGTTFSVTNKATKETTLYKVNNLVSVVDNAIVAKN